MVGGHCSDQSNRGSSSASSGVRRDGVTLDSAILPWSPHLRIPALTFSCNEVIYFYKPQVQPQILPLLLGMIVLD